MVSDVPISLLMSGGLDSTIIYYLMREFTDNITIFHIDNDEAEYYSFDGSVEKLTYGGLYTWDEALNYEFKPD